ncbi:Gx transporter family protein [Thermodesulfobacteriota bacterium]
MTEFQKDYETYKIALLVSLACVLQISESLIPHPIPGLRLGLANLLTLTTLVLLGFRSALEVAVLRAILSSFILGTFMSPGFILSLSGAVISTLIMGFFYWLSGLHPRYRLSIIGISIIGAFSHNMVQLYLAYLLLVKHEGIFVFLPWLSIGAVATGWVVGMVAGGVCRKLAEVPKPDMLERIWPDTDAPVTRHYVPGSSFVHRLHAGVKIAAIFSLAIGVLIFSNFWFYLGLFFFLVVVMIVSQTPIAFIFSRARRYTSLVGVAFLLPVFFNEGTEVVATLMSFKLTHEGLSNGTLFASRILFLMVSSFLLMRTTSPEQMTRGFAVILSPLKYLGISEQRIATILSFAWAAFPNLWETARRAIIKANLKKVKNLRKLLPLLSNMIAILYIETEPQKQTAQSAYPAKIDV